MARTRASNRSKGSNFREPKLKVYEIDDYVELMNSRAKEYVDGVTDGSIITNKWIKLQVKRGLEDLKRDDILLKQEKIDIAFKFFSFIRIPIKSNPEQFLLTNFQAWIISQLFGWYREDGTRKYRYGLIYTARKSGKTMFSVAVMLLLSYYDDEFDSEVYLLATTREQANQGMKYMKSIVNQSPSLKSRSTVRRFDIGHQINGDAILKSLAAKAESLDSLNPNGSIIDEMHAHPDLSLYNVIKSGVLARNNPLILITSTAGFNTEYPFYGMVERGKRVLMGELENDSMFYALYTLDDDDDPLDQTKWVKSNPNLGQTIPSNALSIEWEQAKDSIIEKINFEVKNLNLYRDGIDQWISDSEYLPNFIKTDPEKMRGWKAWGGLDLASTRDIASLVWILQDPDSGRFYVVPEFYFPRNPERKLRSSGIDLGQWIGKGFIIEHQKKTIDHESIKDRIHYWSQIFDVQMLGYDQWNSTLVIPYVETEFGLYCQSVPQNTLFFNFPLKFLEKQLLSNNISMSDNPVMRWMFKNIVLYQDGNGNVKISKNKSNDSVDGPVSLGMAVGCWLKDNFNMEEWQLTDYTNNLKKE
jgi:phage terminase large subunit-like protein